MFIFSYVSSDIFGLSESILVRLTLDARRRGDTYLCRVYVAAYTYYYLFSLLESKQKFATIFKVNNFIDPIS